MRVTKELRTGLAGAFLHTQKGRPPSDYPGRLTPAEREEVDEFVRESVETIERVERETLRRFAAFMERNHPETSSSMTDGVFDDPFVELLHRAFEAGEDRPDAPGPSLDEFPEAEEVFPEIARSWDPGIDLSRDGGRYKDPMVEAKFEGFEWGWMAAGPQPHPLEGFVDVLDDVMPAGLSGKKKRKIQ